MFFELTSISMASTNVVVAGRFAKVVGFLISPFLRAQPMSSLARLASILKKYTLAERLVD